jgi:hypothetical protein
VGRRQLRVDAGHDVTQWKSLILTKKFSLSRDRRRRYKRCSHTSNNSNASTLSPVYCNRFYCAPRFFIRLKV